MGRFLDEFPYVEVRQQQGEILDALEKIYANDKYRYVVIEAGTGVGKSAIAKAIAGVDGRSIVLTATKQLQDQYVRSFGDDGAATVKGRSNYACALNDDLSCAHGQCKFAPKDKEAQECAEARWRSCPYTIAFRKAFSSQMCVTSYSMFLELSRIDSMRETITRPSLIIDECHMLEEQLISFAGFKLSPKELDRRFELQRFLGEGDEELLREMSIYSTGCQRDGYDANVNWIALVSILLERFIADCEAVIAASQNGDRRKQTLDELEASEVRNVKRLLRKLDDASFLNTQIGAFLAAKGDERNNWMVNVRDEELIVQPLAINGLFERFVDKFATKHVIFMSATIVDKAQFCRDLGITPEHTAIIARESPFNPARGPIVVDPIGSMNYRSIASTMPHVVNEVRMLLERHRNQKGIIHTGSYVIAQKLFDELGDKRLLFARDSGETNEMLVSRHQLTKKPTVLLSPSMMAGVDLENDLARFQIIVKAPFASLGDPRVKRKADLDHAWYTVKMVRNFIQACGRGIRSESDWCVTYVLDAYFIRLFSQYSTMLGERFMSRVIRDDEFDEESYRKMMRRRVSA